MNSAYSIPDPNVPDAVRTGFLKVTPAMVTDISGFFKDTVGKELNVFNGVSSVSSIEFPLFIQWNLLFL
jgi:hypothetical protein